MSITMFDRKIEKISVIGSGTIGPDIALYFTKRFHDKDVPVTVVDINPDALNRGEKNTREKVQKGVERNVFTEDQAASMLDNMTWTTSYEEISDASLVVEAATERLSVKKEIFDKLEHLCSEDTILASNSSHFPPDQIFSELSHPERTLVLHYFTPAERNPLVEVVRSEHTDREVEEWCYRFYEELGKAPIRVRSRYGFAINPIFEGLTQAAIMLVENRYGNVKEINAMVRDALGLTVGPFTVMNMTNGNKIIRHGLEDYNKELMNWYGVPDLLVEKIEEGTPWDVADRGEEVDYDQSTYETVRDRIRGATFGLINEVLGSGIVSVSDLNMGCELAMDMDRPFDLMNKIGIEKSLELVENYAKDHRGFQVADPLQDQARSGESWDIPVVLRDDREGVAVVKIRRFTKLNAMNESVFEQLRETFENIAQDERVNGAVLTGFGRKAFVAGADITRFPHLFDDAEKGEEFAREHQEITTLIENLEKPVVCALNGLALGGGMEIAMGCHARIGREGEARLMGQPEPNLGLIPGMGGTQRLPRYIPFKRAWKLLRTAGHLSSEEAKKLGIVRSLHRGDQLEQQAIQLVQDAAAGRSSLERIEKNPIDVPEELPDVDIGHLSEKIDAYLQKAILEGAESTLEEGLDIEAVYFGQCFETEDCKIGVKNFIENGPRSKPEFVHE